jgi:acyl-CoA reductase-like NAD-dependent aldehyde dehydrogenase
MLSVALSISAESMLTNRRYKITQREPIGVCSGIGAWNVSAVLFGWKAAVRNDYSL